MRGHGGFEHNRQSLRIVEELEQKYPGFMGLNLSWEVREGLIKHRTRYDQPGPRKEFSAKSPSLEAQIANLADELIYSSAMIWTTAWTPACFRRQNWNRRRASLRKPFAPRPCESEHGELPAETRRYFIIRCIIDDQVRDVVETSEAAILASRVKTADDVRRQEKGLIRHSPARRKLNTELSRYLFRNLWMIQPARRGAESSWVRQNARGFVQLLFGAPRRNRRSLAQTRRQSRLASGNLRLPLRHDRSIHDPGSIDLCGSKDMAKQPDEM